MSRWDSQGNGISLTIFASCVSLAGSGGKLETSRKCIFFPLSSSLHAVTHTCTDRAHTHLSASTKTHTPSWPPPGRVGGGKEGGGN